MDNIFEKADFTKGSDHKEKLRNILFSDKMGEKVTDSPEELHDEELDMAAGGQHINRFNNIARI